MNKFLSAAIAASMLLPVVAPTAALAQDHHDQDQHDQHQRGDYRDHQNRGPDHRGADWRGPDWRGGPDRRDGPPMGWHQYRRGDRFDRNHAWRYAEIDYRQYHRLRPPPRGYHWVRNGDDALLVGIASGVVASIMIGAMR